jgi:hypothetical protein
MVLQLIALFFSLTVNPADSVQKFSQILSDGTQVTYGLSKMRQLYIVIPPQWQRRTFHEDERFLELRIANDYRKKEFLNTIKPIA